MAHRRSQKYNKVSPVNDDVANVHMTKLEPVLVESDEDHYSDDDDEDEEEEEENNENKNRTKRPTSESQATQSVRHNFYSYALDELKLENADVCELEVEHASQKPKHVLQQTCEIPRWLIIIVTNFFILLLIVSFCIIFAYRQSKMGIDSSCLTNNDCNSYLGLYCTAGKCSCSDVQFWNGHRCVAQRSFNRSCTAQNQCDSLLQLLCMNVTINNYVDSLCWCSSARYWTGSTCTLLKTFNDTCSSNSECDSSDYLLCINGICDCNSTQFWNNQYCENKRLYGTQCFSNYWCNNATAGLQCSTQLPSAGTCDCPSNQYWWSGNNSCQTQLSFNATCLYSYQCSSNLTLTCATATTPNTCQCADRYWYNSSRCTSKFLVNATCTSSAQCDDTVSLFCNLTIQKCSCNDTAYVWDGSQCVVRRSIGGACATNSDCLSTQNLVCGTTNVWNGTCACPTNYYWNSTISLCVLKKLWNQPCLTSYECYDGGYLTCQPSATYNTTICDCSNYTLYWTGFLNNTYSGYCTPKINYGVPSFTCVSSYQCRDYNYVACISGQCTCNTTSQYWDATMCEPKLNYSYPCNTTSMCRDWSPGPSLQCLTPLSGGSTKQCLCTPTQYFDYCQDTCLTAKSWQQACNSSSCYAVSMCDQSKSLSCVNSICNCTTFQWWNTTSCVSKGTYLASCTTGQHYQCQDYNLLSCVSSQCQCGSTMFWSSTSNYCLPKQSYLGTCTSTIECLTAGGTGLSCISGQCKCSTGYTWSSSTQLCILSG